MSEELLIGYPGTCYGMERVSHGLPLAAQGVRYEHTKRVPVHRLPFAPPYWVNRYAFWPGTRFDAVHLFNGVCTSDIPWVSSIELEFPRYFGSVPEVALSRARELIASDHCKLLLPLSEAARTHLLRRTKAEHAELVARKTVVFTGGVAVPDQLYARASQRKRAANEALKVGFVGRLYWHKGGPAVLEAVRRVRESGGDVRLLVVSDLSTRSHIYEPSAAELSEARRALGSTDWIEYHATLPNARVLERLSECDVLAFPTLDESLGWVAIEALALGLPVITTNAFALPELVRDGTEGFGIALPLDDDGRWTGIKDLSPGPHPSYEETHRSLVAGCVGAIERLLESPELGRELGRNGRRKYEQRFRPEVAARRLAELLRGALRGSPSARTLAC